MSTATFEVTGMHCGSCGMLIDESAEEIDGVVRSKTDVKEKRTVIDYDGSSTTIDSVIAAISECGYSATLVSAA